MPTSKTMTRRIANGRRASGVRVEKKKSIVFKSVSNSLSDLPLNQGKIFSAINGLSSFSLPLREGLYHYIHSGCSVQFFVRPILPSALGHSGNWFITRFSIRSRHPATNTRSASQELRRQFCKSKLANKFLLDGSNGDRHAFPKGN